MSQQDARVIYERTDPDDTQKKEKLNDYDREELIQLFISLGFKPQRVVLEGVTKLRVFFLSSDCAPIERKIYASEEIAITYQANVIARDWWRNIILMARGQNGK